MPIVPHALLRQRMTDGHNQRLAGTPHDSERVTGEPTAGRKQLPRTECPCTLNSSRTCKTACKMCFLQTCPRRMCFLQDGLRFGLRYVAIANQQPCHREVSVPFLEVCVGKEIEGLPEDLALFYPRHVSGRWNWDVQDANHQTDWSEVRITAI